MIMTSGAERAGNHTRTPGADGPDPADQLLPFDYAEFDRWYVNTSKNLFEPARQTFVRLLQQGLDQSVSELDRHRIRLTSSRVKTGLRLWSKLQKDKYRAQVRSLDAIPDVIDDLVGIRIVCNNLSDVQFVRGMLATWPASEALAVSGMAVESQSHKEYVNSPKASGYRAYHINLVTQVPGLTSITPVRGELQVRTLLQDGWGELTHEDTYKPGVDLPPHVTTLSRRMADLLATVDDLAQDLRLELDRLAQSAVEESGDPVGEPAAVRHTVVSKDLVLQEASRIIARLTQPAALASIAAQLQGTFGTSIRGNWMGFRTFKNLLMAAVPGVTIVTVGPGYVIPRGATPNPGWPAPLLGPS
jgi:ppGpp synthetase/RelA/SpoT-type nucleotidyltranferase